jgi:hypothetical protein
MQQLLLGENSVLTASILNKNFREKFLEGKHHNHKRTLGKGKYIAEPHSLIFYC